MKVLGMAAASAAVIILSGAATRSAFAADLNNTPVKAVPVSGATTCTSMLDFFTTACQVSAYGVRFYGTIDIGGNYSTHTTPLGNLATSGIGYFPGKNSGAHGAGFNFAPNALSTSNIGLQVKEPLGGGWSFVGQLETGFLPTSLDIASNAGSLQQNAGRSLNQQTLGADGAQNGFFYTQLGYAGVSNDTWGALTFGRQNVLSKDAVLAYDPLGNAFAFSYIGFFGATSGGGDTEDVKTTTAFKYRVNVANLRFGALAQVGGYDQGNASNGVFQGGIGGDWNIGPGTLSADFVGGWTKDAVSESLSGGVTVTPGTFATHVNPTTPQALGVTISDNTSLLLAAKYTVDRLKLYAGYEWFQLAPPSDFITSFTDESGTTLTSGTKFAGLPFTIVNTAFNAQKRIQQTAWVGARYSLTSSLDVAGAYYHVDTSQFENTTGVAGASVATACAVNSLASGNCHGTVDAFSVLLDWQIAPKWDTYIGTLYSKFDGGQASGFLADNNWSTTAGVRFRW